MSHKKVIITLLLLSNIVFSESTQVDSVNWKQYIRAGTVQVSQDKGISGYYRLNRTSDYYFGDLRLYFYGLENNSYVYIRYKNSSKFRRYSRLYRFTTFAYQKNKKAGVALRYHFNQGLGVFVLPYKNGHVITEIAHAYDMSDYLNDTRKTSYLKYGFFWDINFSKIFMNLDFEYFSQISDLLPNEVLSNRYEVSSKINYQLNKFLNVTFGIEYEKYIFKEFIINKNETYNSFYLGIGFKEILEWKL